jgi:hypothetical protein
MVPLYYLRNCVCWLALMCPGDVVWSSVVALSNPLVKNVLSKHCEGFYKVRCVPVWGSICPWLLYFCHRCILSLVTAALSVIKQVFYVCR